MLATLIAGCFSNYNSGGDAGASFDGGMYSSDGESSEGGETATGTVSATAIDLGMVSCGTAPTAKSVSVQNTGTVPVTWSASATAPFAIEGPSSGTVAPSETGTISVGGAAVPTTSDPGVALSGTVTITTNIPGLSSVDVPVTLTPQGGSLIVSPPVTGFGVVQVGTLGGPLNVHIQNVGNMAVNVTLGTPTDPTFAVTYAGAPAAGAIAPGATLAGASATYSPVDTTAKTATVAIQTTDPLCASSSSSISLSGSGTTAPVSIGPSPLDFGDVPCGSTATAQAITIKSGYTAQINFTATLGLSPSPYSLSTMSGMVPAKGSTMITVTPAAIPFPSNPAAGAYDDTLTITTSVPNATPVAIPLTQVAAGAILAITAPSTAFGTVTSVGSLPFTVTNTGTVQAGLTPAITGPGFGATFPGGGIAAPAGGTAAGTATFAPQSNTAVSGTIAVTTTAPLCAPLPTALTFTGTGSIPIASFPGTTLAVTVGDCGKGPDSTATLTIQNTGVAPLQLFSPASTMGDFALVSYTTTPIAASGTGTIVIQALHPAGAGARGTLDDTLTFQTNEPNNPTYKVAVTVTTICG